MTLAATKSDCHTPSLPLQDSSPKLSAKTRRSGSVELTNWLFSEQGSSLENAQIAQAAQKRLCQHHNRQVRSLACEVRDGLVTLRGNVTEYYYKQLAQEAVRHVVGTSRIRNLVVVVASPNIDLRSNRTLP
jgi:osmotically-inducible protein OsmY